MLRTILVSVLFVSFSSVQGQEPGTLKWKYQTEGQIVTSPVVSENNEIYIGVISGPENIELRVLTREGALEKTISLPGISMDTPFIASDGHIYVIVNEGSINESLKSQCRLLALDENGVELWHYDFVSEGATSIVEGGDGSIYLGIVINNGTGELWSFTSNGIKRWEVRLNGHPISRLFILPDGSMGVVATNMGSYLSIFGSDGILHLRKCVETGRYLACDNSGRIYLGGSPYTVIDLTGKTLWTYSHGWATFLSTILDQEGNVYVNCNDESIFAFDRDGNFKWEYTPQERPNAGMVLGSDQTIYCSAERRIFSLNHAGNLNWEYMLTSDIWGELNIDDQGTLYVACTDGSLHALYTSSNGLADSPWPKYQKDSRNSGSAYNPDTPVSKIGNQDYYHGLSGETINLDGSMSTDSNLDPLTYSWILKRRPMNSTFELTGENVSGQTILLNENDRGRFTIGLWVSDNKDGCSYTEVNVDCGVYWRKKIQGEIYDKMAINEDNHIFIATWDSTLQAFNPEGNLEWSQKMDDRLDIPVIGQNGNIYLRKGRSGIVSLSPDGNLLNTYSGQDMISYPPVVGKDNQIIFYEGKQLVALTNDFERIWNRQLEGDGVGEIAIGQDGTIYASSSDGIIYIFDPAGRLNRLISDQINLYTAPAIGQDGTFYYCDEGNQLHALSIDGRYLWDGIWTSYDVSPVLDLNGTVYIKRPYDFSAISNSGEVLWSLQISGNPSPVIGGEGIIYLTTSDSLLLAIDSSGKVQWNYPFKSYSAPAIDHSGRLLLVDQEDYLYAIQTDEEISPKPFWRTKRCNAANSSSLFNENAPTARIQEGDTLLVMPNEAFALTGSASADPDGDILFYSWRLVEKPDSSDFTFEDSTLPDLNLIFTDNQIGRYIFSLIVNDNEDGVSSRRIVVWCGLKWYRNVPNEYQGYEKAPAIVDGIVIVDGRDILSAYSLDGSLKWQHELRTAYYSRPVIQDNGNTVISDFDGNLFMTKLGI